MSRRKWNKILSICLSVSITLSVAQAAYVGEVSAESINFRETSNGFVTGKLYKGDRVAVIQEQAETTSEGMWSKVAVDGVTGYVLSDYLKKVSGTSIELGSGYLNKGYGNIPSNSSVTVKGVEGSDTNPMYIVSYSGSSYKVPVTSLTLSGSNLRTGSSKTSTSSGSSNTSTATSGIANTVRAKVVQEAASHLGKPYVWGGNGPNSFDCSGLMKYVYDKVVIEIPRTATAQCNSMVKVNVKDILPGDLVFFQDSSNPKKMSHVGMYVGAVTHGSKTYTDAFIHAPHTGDVVKYTSLSTYYKPPAAVGRVIFS